MGGDLKTPWDSDKQAFTGTGVEGAGVTSRGSDPNSEGDNGAGMGLDPVWPDAQRATTADGQAESANSVSGLPSLPNRYEPSETPPEMPDLTTRSPGTIDQK